MGEMLIECNEIRAEASYFDFPVTQNVEMFWTLAYVLCVW